jgi:hypothetical protein
MRKDRIIDKQTGKLRKRYFNEHGGCKFPKGSIEAKIHTPKKYLNKLKQN